MERIPLLWQEEKVGEMTVETVGLYTCFSCSCCLPEEGFWHVWLVGDKEEVRLGLLEPAGKCAVLKRRLSVRNWAKVGTLRYARLRCAGGNEMDWHSTSQLPFCTPWLRRELGGRTDLLVRKSPEQLWIAVPYETAKPFPLTQLFCLSRILRIQGREYVVFSFDGTEKPCMPEEKYAKN